MIEVYVGSSRLDTFKDEDINIKLNIQNVKDIGKLFTDYTQNFSVPASKSNSAAFKHYYNADISGGFDASLRQDATIFLDKELFREGTIELMSVDLKNGLAESYEIVFFSAGVNMKDLFGEDQLTDLDFSAYDHEYLSDVVQGGLEGKGLFSGNIIYPLISPVTDWLYDTASGNHDPANIHYHSGGHSHGVYYYDLKPAIRLARIIDAIEAKYGITFTSTFFASSKFTDLYMWCHRREGYMFKEQQNGFTATKIDFTAATGFFNIGTDTTTIQVANSAIIWDYSILSSQDYQVHFFVNDIYRTSRSHSGQVSNEQVYLYGLSGGDQVQMRFSPPTNWDGGTITFGQVICEGTTLAGAQLFTCTRLTAQSFAADVIVSDQMPEQKVYDFMLGIVKMFNLVIDPSSRTSFNVKPLDDWYADGVNHEITEYVDNSTTQVIRPELYQRISFKYQESDAYLMRSYREANGGRAYGDLNADFVFDGGELNIESTMQIQKWQKLEDVHTAGDFVNFLVGKSIDKEGDPYINQPVVFYSSTTLNVSAYPIGFVDQNDTMVSVNAINHSCNVNGRTADAVTQMITYGLEVDPFTEQSYSQTLYNQYWVDYITDLYSTERRIYKMKAVLPMKLIYEIKMNDKLDISGRRYVINEISINLRTREATLELLNDV